LLPALPDIGGIVVGSASGTDSVIVWPSVTHTHTHAHARAHTQTHTHISLPLSKCCRRDKGKTSYEFLRLLVTVFLTRFNVHYTFRGMLVTQTLFLQLLIIKLVKTGTIELSDCKDGC